MKTSLEESRVCVRLAVCGSCFQGFQVEALRMVGKLLKLQPGATLQSESRGKVIQMPDAPVHQA